MSKENETPEITDKTYTLNSESCAANANCVDIKILLPTDNTENPYKFTTFDVSQTIDGKHQNALFIYMKKLNDDGEDLSGYDTDKEEHLLSIDYSQVIALDGEANYSAYNQDSAAGTIVVVYHDTDDTDNHKQTCAEKLYTEVSNVRTQLVINGNFQTNMALMGSEPKKTGMSMIPQK